MFDSHSLNLINDLPDLPGMNKSECRRALSQAYFHVLQTKVNTEPPDRNNDDFMGMHNTLRRMGDALESVSVFDPLNGIEVAENLRNASAFVAAEAISLLSDLSVVDSEKAIDFLFDEHNYNTIESILLYMIGGYDVNASTLANKIQIENSVLSFENADLASLRDYNSRQLTSRIIKYCKGDVSRPHGETIFDDYENTFLDGNYSELVHQNFSRFYGELAKNLDRYLDWLGGYIQTDVQEIILRFENIRKSAISERHPNFIEFSLVYHLSSLILASIKSTLNRSTVALVPNPISDPESSQEYSDLFRQYILARVRGDEHTIGRPFLWPSALEYVKRCLPGPSSNAVVSMPTGSGKSFIAELASVHALERGWVLYLAPTNALVTQIKRDLSASLKSLKKISIRSFVGDDEYTPLQEEQVNTDRHLFVAVMTPEKCSLALRLNPDIFSKCSLCVFDECHLINDKNGRGVTADVVMAKVISYAPSIKILLMSAIISNPEDLASWLTEAVSATETVNIKWRPSRTLRGLLFLDGENYNKNKNVAKKKLDELPPHRVNQKFNTPMGVLVGLSGAWSSNSNLDYKTASLPIDIEAQVSRRPETEPPVKSWKNTASAKLAEMLANSDIPTICFLMSSKHHVFSSANKVKLNTTGESVTLPAIVEAYLFLAEKELGVDSALRKLLLDSIAVHSRSLLPMEHAASEYMFVKGSAKLMFATATLAQGLNFPAIAVVVAGTSIGDGREEVDQERVNSYILNGFGRAGRPGVANHGVAILVSDKPFKAHLGKSINPKKVIDTYPVMTESDASVIVSSPLDKFIDNIIVYGENYNIEGPYSDAVVDLLVEELVTKSESSYLNKTLAMHQKTSTSTDDSMLELISSTIDKLKQKMNDLSEIGEIVRVSSLKSGINLFKTAALMNAYSIVISNQHEKEGDYSELDWFDLFIKIMAELPPIFIAEYLPDKDTKTTTVLTKMRSAVLSSGGLDQITWVKPEDWDELWQDLGSLVKKYMMGDTYADIASVFLGKKLEDINGERTKGDHPIPATINFIIKVVDKLAMDAGGLLALHEQILKENQDKDYELPINLASLPLMIKHGCDSVGVLSWFRFGFRNRVSAHSFQFEFPVPSSITDDSKLKSWVLTTRKAILSGKLLSMDEIINNTLLAIRHQT